ncbi:MAG: hypothetical protein U5K00_00605 [Melioribacteraceae bacterium]|nr:hypothetical protein [Melioribacteraceae bacterium]
MNGISQQLMASILVCGIPQDGMEVHQYDPLEFSWGINQSSGSLKYYLANF